MPDVPEWTIGRLLQWTADYFQQQGIDSPRLDAEILLATARKCARIDLYAAFHEPASDRVRAAFRELVRRRAEGTPVAYLVGKREFYSMPFRVTPDVLIPRPETESLVVAALDQVTAVRAETSTDRELAIADVGTGSGAIAVALARHAGPCRVAAIDTSPAALAIAKENAANLGTGDRIDWFESDLFTNVSPDRLFDVVVSNPPYVAEHEFDRLDRDIRDHEPRQALIAGPTGTEVIERLLAQSADRLRPGGWLVIEISPTISDAVKSLFAEDERWDNMTCSRDLAGNDRVVVARRKYEPS